MERMQPFRIDRFYGWIEPHPLGVRLFVHRSARPQSELIYTCTARDSAIAEAKALRAMDGSTQSTASKPRAITPLPNAPVYRPKRRYRKPEHQR